MIIIKSFNPINNQIIKVKSVNFVNEKLDVKLNSTIFHQIQNKTTKFTNKSYHSTKAINNPYPIILQNMNGKTTTVRFLKFHIKSLNVLKKINF